MSHMLLKLFFPRMNHEVNIHFNVSGKGLVTHLAEVVSGLEATDPLATRIFIWKYRGGKERSLLWTKLLNIE